MLVFFSFSLEFFIFSFKRNFFLNSPVLLPHSLRNPGLEFSIKKKQNKIWAHLHLYNIINSFYTEFNQKLNLEKQKSNHFKL